MCGDYASRSGCDILRIPLSKGIISADSKAPKTCPVRLWELRVADAFKRHEIKVKLL